MDLGVAWVREVSALLVCGPLSGNRATHSVGGEVEYVNVSTGCQADCVGSIGLELTGNQVTNGDTTGYAVNNNQVQHLTTGIHLNRTSLDLTGQCGVRTQQQLLTGLTTGIEGTGNLSTTE